MNGMAMMLKSMGVDFDAIQAMAVKFIAVTEDAAKRLERIEQRLTSIEAVLGADHDGAAEPRQLVLTEAERLWP